MNEAVLPTQNFALFREKLGLDGAALLCLEPYQKALLARAEAFADRLFEVLSSLPESRRVLELMQTRSGHRTGWRAWYRGLITQGLSPSFEDALWRSGVRHVSRNVDQRAVHLAYCTARLFLAEVVEADVALEDRARVGSTLSRLIDLCLMVETDAFLAGTSQCDREVINGIAHQVRNPVTVIGGVARNLLKKVDAGSIAQPLLSALSGEAQRLERMVTDVAAFVEIDQRPPSFSALRLADVLGAAIRRLEAEGFPAEQNVEIPPDAGDVVLDSDRAFAEEMFYHLLQNSLEAGAASGDLKVRLSVEQRGALAAIQISNSGTPPTEEEQKHLFAPFFSSKPTGSGFGLPIAALVARKAHGDLQLALVPGVGARVTVTLPLRPAEQRQRSP